jgi:hypothetical protein
MDDTDEVSSLLPQVCDLEVGASGPDSSSAPATQGDLNI